MEETKGGEDKQLGPEEDLNSSKEEEYEPDEIGPRVMVMPHKLGGIAVVVRGADGTTAEGRINVNEAALIASHLQALITMAFGTAYNTAAQQEEALRANRIVVPGR